MDNWLLDILKRLWELFFPKPTGILPTVSGGDEVFTPSVAMDGNWQTYLSQPFEGQFQHGFDELDCVSQSGVHAIEAVLNYFYKNNLFPSNGSFKELLEKGGYINDQGFVELSVPYIARLAGTTHQGLAMDKFWQTVNTCGLVPKKVWNKDNATTWEEYYADIPVDVKAAGQDFAKIFQWNWKVIKNDAWDAPIIADLKNALYHSPIHFASELGTHDFDGIDRPTGKKTYAHARTIFRVDDYIEILDQYQYPSFLHRLSLDFPIACAIVCSLKIT
jgi:hypothetical protein